MRIEYSNYKQDRHANTNRFSVYQQDPIRKFNGIWDLIKDEKQWKNLRISLANIV